MTAPLTRDTVLVSADQMQQIETLGFEAGMPIAALMEKAGQRLFQWVQQHHPGGEVGILVGPGHNGGDALVVARELFLHGRSVQLYCPFTRLKPLTEQHQQYAAHLGIADIGEIQQLRHCQVVIDGLFGFGLTRPIADPLAADIRWLNQSGLRVVSIDLPSGIDTDSGEPLGIAVRASHTLCLGLWKQATVQTAALPYLGTCDRIDLDLPVADIQTVLGHRPTLQRLTPAVIRSALPLDRDPTAHKYSVGQLLLVAGSKTYAGAALLAARGARASGVGMVTLAVPESLRLLAVAQVPEALVVGCPEQDGVIQALPETVALDQYDAIALGPGLTRQATAAVLALLPVPMPLVIDADALNILAARPGTVADDLRQRPSSTILTPHPGEFRRLFPDLPDRLDVAQTAASLTGSTIVLKRARSAIASPDSPLWINPISTPALARGGSGDVLTGLIGGLLAQHQAQQHPQAATLAALGGVGWHAAAACYAARHQSILGVDPLTLAAALPKGLAAHLS